MRRHPKVPELHDSAKLPKVGRIRRVKRWWMGSTKTLMVSSVFLVIVAATAVWLVAFPASAPSIPAAIAAAQASTKVPAEAVAKLGCKAQKPVVVSPETLVLTAYSTQWYPMGTMLAPKSKAAGPVNSTAHQCFARTPEGALYAVATRVAIEARNGGVTGRQFSGYQWLAYSPDTSTVSLAARAVNGTGDGTITSRTFTAQWVNNDWQVSVLAQPVEQLDGLRTFTPWGGA